MTQSFPPPNGAEREEEPLFEPDPPPFGVVDPAVVKPSKFGASPWWSSGWWNLPPAGFAQDLACDAGTVGGRAVAAVSVRGHKHRLAGEPNQDSFAIRWTTTDAGPLIVAVVCDGMSSARHSAYGSRRVANLFADELAAGLGERLIQDDRADEDAQSTLGRVIAAASAWSTTDLGAPPDEPTESTPADLETTLTFAVVAADAEAPRCAIGWIGDSPAFELRKERWQRLEKQHDAAGGLQTAATKGVFSSPQLSIRRGDLDDGAALLLCSDGIGNFIDDGEDLLAVGEQLAIAWSTPVDILTFANQASFDLPTADDDRTAVMIWPAVSPNCAA